MSKHARVAASQSGACAWRFPKTDAPIRAQNVHVHRWFIRFSLPTEHPVRCAAQQGTLPPLRIDAQLELLALAAERPEDP